MVVADPTIGAGLDVARDIAKRPGADAKGKGFLVALVGCLVVTLAILVALVGDVIADGWDVLTGDLGRFLTQGLAPDVADAGVWQGLKGTIMLCVIVAVVAFPLGISAAVYLEEYASDNRFTRLVNINIRNLAGVPSIVYGLLGLAIFVRALGDNGTGGLTGGRTVIAGGLTLAALVLPLVIITSQEALRAVPAGIREGSLALGATGWETIRHHTVPAAASGILTGTVVALARAAGEAAPILLVGAATGFLSTGNQGLWEQVTQGRFTAMPIVIFSWARQPASQGWGELVAAAAVALVVLIFAMNALAIFLRNRYEQKW
jgi:phosphate transport system permease protein